jgi:hypothetical protein
MTTATKSRFQALEISPSASAICSLTGRENSCLTYKRLSVILTPSKPIKASGNRKKNMTAEQMLDEAIARRDAMRSDYRAAINPNNHMSAATAQRIENLYAEASAAVKIARRAFRAEQSYLKKASNAAVSAIRL